MYYSYYNSPLGLLELHASDKALLGVALVEDLNHAKLPAHGNSCEAARVCPLLAQTAQELDEYFSGKRRVFDVPLGFEKLVGTPFMHAVWQALREIPYGETRSYAEIATAIGHPRAARAVGNANNKNPHMIIVPCHRVVGINNPWGYASGEQNKRFLLELEGVRL